ncbi:Na+/solute symporter [Natrialba chahannaoensis JCM 10990]|uniref:Na+/solute symporter n=2 Tax=Natrialba chahannaoensis TaxID=68911 RepID=M0AAJ1_9EURY|nr:Na+/solute symporter [Natrialba chahannaoensis JCM 10990]
MLALAYYIYRQQGVDDTSEFVTAGGRAQLGLATASFAVTWMWAGDVVGVPEYVGFVGIAGTWMYAAPAVLSGLLVIPFALRMRRLFPQGYTYSEYFIERFGRRAHLVVVLVILYTMVLGGIVQLYVGGFVIGGLTGIDPNVVMGLLMLIIGLYILVGGLWGSLTTDFVQFVSAIILVVLFIPLLLFEAGGPGLVYEDMISNLGEEASVYLSMQHFDPIGDFFLPYALGLGVWGIVSLSTWQRVFAVRRDKTTRFLTIGAIGVFTIISMYAVIGFVGLAAFEIDFTGEGGVHPENLSIEALGLLPEWSLILFMLVLLMVLGSSTDSYLTALASLTSRDIFYQNVSRDASDEAQLWVARGASIFFAFIIFIGTVWALDNVGFVTLLLASGIGATGLAGPFALSLFWHKTSSTGFITGVVCSQLVSAYLFLGSPALPLWTEFPLWQIMAIGHAIAITLTLVVSLVNPDDFDFEAIEHSDATVRADGGEER